MKTGVGAKRGFTIVELIIVIVVIAILAAITIVTYNNITKQAIDASLKSDLRNMSTTLELDGQTSGSYPATSGAADSGKGLKASGDNVLTYIPFNGGYCIAVSNSKATQPLQHIDANTGAIENGGCGTIVSTVAGNPNYGYTDGTGKVAQFNSPTGVSVLTSGDALIPDAGCGCIRKVTPAGVVTTIYTRTDSGADAHIASDASGNFYLSDWTGCIKKVTPAGVMTVLAGVCTWPTRTIGSTNGTGSAARFNEPQGITLDASGNIYVADAANNLIRMVTPGGTVSTIAGSGAASFLDGTGTAAQFKYPTGIDIDSSGNLFVIDSGNYRVRKITLPSKQVNVIAGSSTRGRVDGTGVAAQFYGNWQGTITIASDGTMYVGDQGVIRKVTPAGVVTTIAGSATSGNTDGRGTNASLGSYFLFLDIDPSGLIWIADQQNNVVRRISQ